MKVIYLGNRMLNALTFSPQPSLFSIKSSPLKLKVAFFQLVASALNENPVRDGKILQLSISLANPINYPAIITTSWQLFSKCSTPYETNRSAADLQQICFMKNRLATDHFIVCKVCFQSVADALPSSSTKMFSCRRETDEKQICT